MRFEVDDVQLSDLGPSGWFGVAIAGAGVALGVDGLVDGLAGTGDLLVGVGFGALIILVGAVLAYEDARPECEGTCDHCGEHVQANSSREGVDEYVLVVATGSPRRASLGPLSVVIGRQKDDKKYCSGECAAVDERVLLEKRGGQKVPATTSSEGADA